MPESIQVFYNGVVTEMQHFGHHKYIVYTNKNANQYFARGGPHGSDEGSKIQQVNMIIWVSNLLLERNIVINTWSRPIRRARKKAQEKVLLKAEVCLIQ